MEKIQIKLTKKHLIIVSVVLMVALVVGMGAMTYSRYASSYNSGTQTATAAKWGFVVTANADNLFGETYKTNNEGNGVFATVTGTGDIAVKANSDASIIAPGTTGYMTISISGMAEVMAQLNISVTLDGTISDGESYKPVEWTLIKNGDNLAEATWVSDPSSLSSTQVIDAGTSVSGYYELHWRWVFSSSTDNDKKDTVIGAKVADTALADVNAITGLALTEDQYNAYTTQISFSANITIEQIQDNPNTPANP